MGIRTHAHARQFGIDTCATRNGVLKRFEHQNTGPFAEDKAIAVLVPGSAGGFR